MRKKLYTKGGEFVTEANEDFVGFVLIVDGVALAYNNSTGATEKLSPTNRLINEVHLSDLEFDRTVGETVALPNGRKECFIGVNELAGEPLTQKLDLLKENNRHILSKMSSPVEKFEVIGVDRRIGFRYELISNCRPITHWTQAQQTIPKSYTISHPIAYDYTISKTVVDYTPPSSLYIPKRFLDTNHVYIIPNTVTGTYFGGGTLPGFYTDTPATGEGHIYYSGSYTAGSIDQAAYFIPGYTHVNYTPGFYIAGSGKEYYPGSYSQGDYVYSHSRYEVHKNSYYTNGYHAGSNVYLAGAYAQGHINGYSTGVYNQGHTYSLQVYAPGSNVYTAGSYIPGMQAFVPDYYPGHAIPYYLPPNITGYVYYPGHTYSSPAYSRGFYMPGTSVDYYAGHYEFMMDYYMGSYSHGKYTYCHGAYHLGGPGYESGYITNEYAPPYTKYGYTPYFYMRGKYMAGQEYTYYAGSYTSGSSHSITVPDINQEEIYRNGFYDSGHDATYNYEYQHPVWHPGGTVSYTIPYTRTELQTICYTTTETIPSYYINTPAHTEYRTVTTTGHYFNSNSSTFSYTVEKVVPVPYTYQVCGQPYYIKVPYII